MSSGKKIVIAIAALAVFCFGVFAAFMLSSKGPEIPAVKTILQSQPKYQVIGKSVEGRKIEAFTYLSADEAEGTHLVFVGGIHGGYEWNSVLLAYQFMDYLSANPKIIPPNLSITVIPSANPDGVYKVVGKEGRFGVNDVSKNKTVLASGRFNAHDIDLNRNFDCKWQATSTWQTKTVSAGKSVFSEPESQAVRNFLLKNKPAGVVFWHSASNAVYASQCENGILPQTLNIMNTYAKASGYPAVKTFDAYATTGAADDWLASIGIPAMTVELKTHEAIEWEKNLAGVKALFKYYSEN